MELYQIPCFNRDLRGQSLREQMIARLRQIDGGFHRESELFRMSDYALLCAFEVAFRGIADNTVDSETKAAFDAGMKFGQERLLTKINQTFSMNEGKSVIPSSVDSIKSQSKIWSNK